MWKQVLAILGLIAVVLFGCLVYLSDKIYLREEFSELSIDREQLFSKQQVTADLEFLYRNFSKIHPNIADVLDNNEFIEIVESLPDRGLTRQGIYKEISHLNGLISDGHTLLRRPNDEWRFHIENDGKVFPFVVSINDKNEIVIEEDLSNTYSFNKSSRITSINGVSSEELARYAVDSQSGENLALRRAYASKSFYKDLWSYQLHHPFKIEISNSDGIVKISHDGISGLDYQKRIKEYINNDSYAFQILDDNIGLLTFSKMSGSLANFQEFLDTTFKQIKENKIESLILDIRQNGGGDSRFGDMLNKKISKYKYPALDVVSVKVTEEIKDYYRTLLPVGFRWIPLHKFVPILQLINDTSEGEEFDFYPDSSEPETYEDNTENHYSGDVYVLTGPLTYSSAAIFAAPLKHFGRAVFVGKPSGEPLSFYGEIYPFELPNSRLKAQVSHKRFNLVGSGAKDKGIQPHVYINSQNALAETLDLIRQKKEAHISTSKIDVLDAVDALVSMHLFNANELKSNAWLSFRNDLQLQLPASTSTNIFVSIFNQLIQQNELFSHFEIRAPMNSKKLQQDKTQNVELKFMDSKTAFLKVRSFLGSDTGNMIQESLDAVKASDADYLVIDLRGNLGGNLNALPLISNLVEEDILIAALVGREWYDENKDSPSTELLNRSKEFGNLRQGNFERSIKKFGFITLWNNATPPVFDGSVTILVDKKTASTSEIVSYVLQKIGRAKVVGEKTSGEVLNARVFKLPGSLELIIPVSDVYIHGIDRLEGKGVIPNVLKDPKTEPECLIGKTECTF